MIEDVEREKRWIPIQSDYKKFVAEQEKYNTTKIPEIGATLPKSTPQSQAPTPPPTPQQPPLQQKEQKEPQKVAAMNREVSERLKTELQKAVPSWAKDGLGLKGSEASKVQRSVRTEQQTRLPTVSELRDGNEESIPENRSGKLEVFPIPTNLTPFDLFTRLSDDGSKNEVHVFSGCIMGECYEDVQSFAPHQELSSTYPGGWKADSRDLNADTSVQYIYVEVQVDPSAEVQSDFVQQAYLRKGSSLPSNSATSKYLPIGQYIYTDGIPYVSTSSPGAGNINVSACRIFYAGSAPYYDLIINR